MSDPVDLANLASHGGTAVLGAGGVGALMRWLSGREAQEVNTRLALMEQKLDQLVAGAAKADDLREAVAVLKQTVEALHDRLDRLERTNPRRTNRRSK